jgi:hypothetical protein
MISIYKTTSIIVLCVILAGCVFFRDKDKKLYRKGDFVLYQPNFIDSSHSIKFDGVYINTIDSGIGFMRFFPDGKVVRGGCYDYSVTNPNECFDNEQKLSLYGYYWVRNDTLFTEVDDNVPISSGVWIDVHRIINDTIVSLYGFERSKLKDKSLKNIPGPFEKGVLKYNGKCYYEKVELSTRIKLNW